MQADLSEIRVRLKEHPELVRQMTDSAITLSDPDEILQNLQVQIQDDFPALTDTSYTLKYVPEALELSLIHIFPRFKTKILPDCTVWKCISGIWPVPRPFLFRCHRGRCLRTVSYTHLDVYKSQI